MAVKENRHNAAEMNLFLQDWRVARFAIAKLGSHFGNAFVVDRQIAAVLVVRHALNQYSKLRITPARGKLPDIERLSIFLGALIDKACEVFPAQVIDKAAGHRWCISCPVGYPQWYAITYSCENRCPDAVLANLELCYARTKDEQKQMRQAALKTIVNSQLEELLKNSKNWSIQHEK